MPELRVPPHATEELRAIINKVNFLLNRPNGGDNIHKEGFSCYRTRTGIISVRYRGADVSLTSQLADVIEKAGYPRPNTATPGVVTFSIQRAGG